MTSQGDGGVLDEIEVAVLQDPHVSEGHWQDGL
jgi:hypothetical protein